MKAKSHNEDSAILKRIARPIVIGACVGAISCLLVLLVMAAVMAAQNIPKAAVTPMAIVAAAFGSFIGEDFRGKGAALRRRRRASPVCGGDHRRVRRAAGRTGHHDLGKAGSYGGIGSRGRHHRREYETPPVK